MNKNEFLMNTLRVNGHSYQITQQEYGSEISENQNSFNNELHVLENPISITAYTVSQGIK